MDISEIIKQLTDKFGGQIDTAKITQLLGGMDYSKMSLTDIVSKLQSAGGLLGDLDGDGKVEAPIDELKGKAAQMLGGKLGSIFGK